MSKREKITHFSRIVLFIALLVAWAGPGIPANTAPHYDTEPPPTEESIFQALAEEGTARVIVALQPQTALGNLQAQAQQLGQIQMQVVADILQKDFQLIHRYWTVPGMVGTVTTQGLEKLRQNPQVRAIALDMPVYPALEESSAVIQAHEARERFGIDGAGVTIAVLDSGIDLNHPDLAKRVIAQHCFTHSACSPNDTDEGEAAQDIYGHGTRVAGVIASQGTTTPQGIAPGAAIVAVQVMDDLGQGWTSDVIAAIDWVVANQARLNIDIINLSLGGGLYSGICDEQDAITMVYSEAIQTARQAGIAVFAASGNQAQQDALVAPACVSGAIAVGSTYDADIGSRSWSTCVDAETEADKITCFSNSSAALDLLAPGSVINTTALGGGQAADSGTSIAAPHAAAVAALMLHQNPDLTPEEIEQILKETGTLITDPRNGRSTPRINALAAVQAVAEPTPMPTVISGTVYLQGRSQHANTIISLSEAPCSTSGTGTTLNQTGSLSQTTDAEGHFEITLNQGQLYQCLHVYHPRYLRGELALPVNTAGTLTLPAGDIIEDNIINIFDLARVASRYGGDDPVADINNDGTVNIFDLTLVAGNYGKRGPITDWK